ncbi:hypothetical protein BtBc_05535 [Bacillus thuringiensis]|uniref:Uncharacterized protein n=2 Tax=Bacillus cereus group TaxID=86661 RepID=A0A643LU18_BACTU|nr:hypothetical protein YBT1520_05470 [Bacillus thuringiensis serovar kurstaki str. YBT-1520]AIE32219.1 hypothetical protein BTK_05520 [Bacillus thuringiensis serovar kurstaki str. HD-1]AJK43464.1 hypothetical protein BG08_4916 [Bacillus thuringiensis serovar kurstaki]AKJ58372.1 hypothetical protein XI92_08595 [Bacillus thuringiensis]EJV84793.1 hypothetical protein IG1_02993 [Bacillus cereus HD73]EOP42446.1 hypothetical protein IGG_03932 [Bacillus cereus HuB13-1]EOP71714.1 hypothetical protei
MNPIISNELNLFAQELQYFLLILNIKTIINKYINIEKFITKLTINDSKLQCKLLSKSLLPN